MVHTKNPKLHFDRRRLHLGRRQINLGRRIKLAGWQLNLRVIAPDYPKSYPAYCITISLFETTNQCIELWSAIEEEF